MNNATLTLPTTIGAELGGGIYVGPHFEGGQVRHLIAAHDTLPTSQWDAALKAAGKYRGGGFSDWRLPSKNETMSALMHAQGLFEKGWHWTGTPYDSNYAWAVGFEYGRTDYGCRYDEFRVRPFRIHQFSPSTLSQPAAAAITTLIGTSDDLNLAASLVRSAVAALGDPSPHAKKIDWFVMLEHATEILDRRRDIAEAVEGGIEGASHG